MKVAAIRSVFLELKNHQNASAAGLRAGFRWDRFPRFI